MVLESCSEGIIALAIVGGVVLYLLVGLLLAFIASGIGKNMDKDDRECLFVMVLVLWPIAIVGGIVAGILYVVARLFLNLFFGATEEYVNNAVSEVNNRIDEECSVPVDVSDSLDIFDVDAPKFKAGDVITGIVPQTNQDGSNMSYKHLYQGCKCRVLSIRSNGSMQVILIDHKDKAAHADYIGKTFTVPARNFTKVKRPARKRKAVKKKSKR